MDVKIDRAGRIVVPKAIRERLRFQPDTELEAIEVPEGVLLRRREHQPSMLKVGGLWVHQGVPEPGVQWDIVLDAVREERIHMVSGADK